MNTISLAQLQKMTNEELITVDLEMVNATERLDTMRLLLDRLDSAIYDLDRTQERVEDLKSYLDREKVKNTDLKEEVYALRGRNSRTRRSTGEREMNTERNFELKVLQAYESRLTLLLSARGLPEEGRKSIEQTLAEVRRKINLILNEGNWEI